MAFFDVSDILGTVLRILILILAIQAIYKAHNRKQQTWMILLIIVALWGFFTDFAGLLLIVLLVIYWVANANYYKKPVRAKTVRKARRKPVKIKRKSRSRRKTKKRRR